VTALGGGSIVIHRTSSPLLALGGPAGGGAVTDLTARDLRPLLAAAIDRWAAAGLDSAQRSALVMPA
jgi:hypothetical protein